MKRLSTILLLLTAVCFCSLPAYAQKSNVKQYRDDIREYKHNYFRKKLDLSREQANSFFEVYDKMDDAITALNDEARAVETKIYDAPAGTITDIEYEMATRTLLDVKGKEAAIEQEYYEKLNEILSKKQIFELRKIERDFNMQLLRYHHNKRNNKK